ncbi:DUF6240 domain-containing protein [Lachnospiraceae bacterium OttesenSCG-928-D06]|nr:DUF6240 domain-containing protein [Lachnospiraceae bacterium OttesenSCG-928-D06]
MKITFENGIPGSETKKLQQNNETPHSNLRNSELSGNRGTQAYSVKIGGDNQGLWENDTLSGKQKKAKSLTDIQEEAGNQDVALLQNYKTAMAHTLSEEDYAALSEEGFKLEYMDPESVVTIVDKIKAQMVLGGTQVAGYTDDLDMETLAAAVGDAGLAQKIAESFRKADIPLTEENMNETVQAVNMAANLREPETGEYRYMTDQEMDANVWDFYQAKSSGAANDTKRYASYYADGVNGYFAQKADSSAVEIPQEQIENVIRQAGFDVTEQTLSEARWIVENDLPLTKENLSRYHELKNVTFPLEENQVVEASAVAIADGVEAFKGNLMETETIYEKAKKWVDYYQSGDREQYLQLSARRQLEEVRLHMSVEVNVKLLRSGFSIDTSEMEALIEALKSAEQQVAEEYFPEARSEEALEQYKTFQAVCEKIPEIPFYPAEILGEFHGKMDTTILQDFCETGHLQKETYIQAEKSYEALMTKPRSDMGDYIQKAFTNVDDILEDLGIEITKETQKAVRILAYNHMEITVENLESIKNAEQMVTDIIDKMKPASVLQMIRDGVNPLEQSMEELGKYFAEREESFEEQTENYSQFLLGLEKNKGITAEERSAYIGIYRLLHQIKKADGAAEGALVNSQAELNFSNLLSAIRSGKHSHYDVKVSDTIGTITSMLESGVSISEQIARGYGKELEAALKQVAEDGEAKEDYKQYKMELLQEAAASEEECLALLRRNEVPVNAMNLLAAKGIRNIKGLPFSQWKEKFEEDSKNWSDFESLWEELGSEEDFSKTYEEVLGDLSKEIENDGYYQAKESVDIKSMQLMHKQMTIMSSQGKREEYHLPLYIGEELTQIHLVIEENTGNGEVLKIALNTEKWGALTATFTWDNGVLVGQLNRNEGEAVMKLSQIADIFLSDVPTDFPNIQMNTDEEGQRMLGNNSNKKSMEETTENPADNQLLYRIAKQFIYAVKQAAS